MELLLLLLVQVMWLGVSRSMTQQQGKQAAAAACSMGHGAKDLLQQREARATGLQRTGQDWVRMPGAHVTQVWQAVHLHLPHATPQQVQVVPSSTAKRMVHTTVMLC